MKKINFNTYQVVAFDPTDILTYQAPQNDHLDLSFVKDFYVVGKKMTKNGQVMVIYKSYFFFFKRKKIYSF